ncbi:uncharacterized protein MICPUCDRAFT_45028 [Micromonas pusilla CCMP1545]|uniref:Predicted protein n=1 Tax=Micromonas pusilla (strain CCMP1545) TaxID=564608 RepID=C1N895_MICPC|nr:uncharacterized protein MICPUCDRAFT_45028 [Micromonas pusilla CCMP1545]EEH51851.1 predicted protein [Micromonas pusilla CCMP1545]|eukprot:XP_003064229.1 predicted protein [Micromonas pusilla CCMP1545]
MTPPRLEFGGTPGVVAIVLLSHLAAFYVLLCVCAHGGALFLPTSPNALLADLRAHATPTPATVAAYLGFLATQAVLAMTLPGAIVLGLPIETEPFDVVYEAPLRLEYRCNALAGWWVTLVALGALVYFRGDAPLLWIADNWGRLMTTAIVVADIASVVAYVSATIYDWFTGAELNPRVFSGRLDLKMWSEIRVSWVTLFVLTLAAAAKAGFNSSSMLLLTAHWLYANACQKGEESVPFTLDIFHEKWGWMLIFWNLAGVPFLYSANAFFIAHASAAADAAWGDDVTDVYEPLSILASLSVLFVLLVAYYVWDTAQSQRTRFRMQRQGTYVPRGALAFPSLPWGMLTDPTFIETRVGSPLLTSGWIGRANKIHYTADFIMATCWALSCGVTPWFRALPWTYPTFFGFMIAHRAGRDERRCAEKYGEDWTRYREIVPHRFVPGWF